MNSVYKIYVGAGLKTILLTSLLLTLRIAAAQPPSLRGFVGVSGQPLPGAVVTLPGGHRTVLTDSSGFFSLSLPTGEKFRLRVSAAGCLPLDTVLRAPFPKAIRINLQPHTASLDEVVITATLKPVSKQASPIPVEVYTPAYFKKNPAPNLFEALQLVNGVQPQLNCNVCNAGDIHINGMEGPYTMVLIDGMPIVSSLSTVYGLSGIPSAMIKSVEVVKGPASTLYGSEAIGGLINIITKDAVSAPRLKTDFSVTGIGEYNADIGAGYRIRSTQGLLGLNLFDFNSRRDINRDGFTDLTLQRRFSLFNKWQHTFSSQVQSALALRYVHENRWGGEMHWQPRFRGGDQVYGEQVLTRRMELISNTRWGDHWNFDLSWNRHRQESWYGQTIYAATQQVAFGQVRWTKTWGKHAVLAGLPLRYTFFDDNTPATAALNGRNRPDRIFLPGIFLQDEWAISDQLLLLSGLRYDYHSRHGSILTPRLSLKYTPQAGQVFRLSMGNGYRVVNLFTEDHAALTGARDVVISGTLQPEQSWNVNLQYSATVRYPGGFGNIDIGGFVTRFSNRIVPDYLTDSRKIIYANLNGYALSRGLTLNTSWNFVSGLKLIAGATLLDVFQSEKDSTGKSRRRAQLFAPAFSGTFAITYTIRKLVLDLTGRVNGPMLLPVVEHDFRPERSPWYGILNLQVSGPLGKQLEGYAGVKNLLNFIPEHPILHPDDPFNRPGGKYYDLAGQPNPATNPHGYSFDPSYNYAPMQGAKWFVGIRWQLP